jgi:hypothetical protein
MTDHTSPVTATSARLAREWALLCTRPRLVARANAWGVRDAPFASLDDLVRAVGGGGDRTTDADRRLRRLVEVARTDDLAARVVVERLTPGLLTLARRRRRHDPNAFEHLLAAAWIAVRTYNAARRPSTIAAALLSDADYNAFRRWTRHRASTEVPMQWIEYLAPESECDPTDELAELIELARAAGVDTADLEFVDQLATMASTEDVAKARSVTSRAIRYRRDRVTSTLREIARAA